MIHKIMHGQKNRRRENLFAFLFNSAITSTLSMHHNYLPIGVFQCFS